MAKSTRDIPGKKDVSVVSEVEKFLRIIAQDGPWRLTAMPPDKGPISQMFTDIKAALAFVAKHDGKANVFFQPNSTREGVPSNKAKLEKVDVARGDRFWADFDPAPPPNWVNRNSVEEIAAHWDKQRTGLLSTSTAKIIKLKLPSPSTSIFSGGGVQHTWLIAEPYDLSDPAQRAEYEHLNQQLAKRLGADNVQNSDRVLRVPGTMNLPDRKKREKDGRIPARAELIPGCIGEAYFRQDFVRVLGSPKSHGAPSTPRQDAGVSIDAGLVPRALENLDQLDQWDVPARCREVIAHGFDPDDPTRFAAKTEPPNSESQHYVTCELHRRGVPDDLILGIISDGVWKISAHVRRQEPQKRDRYAHQQLAKAKAEVAKEAQKFLRTKSEDGTPGRIRNLRHNVKVALNELGVRLSFNAFSHQYLVAGVPGYDGELQDETDAHLRGRIEKEFEGFDPGKEKYLEAVSDLARENTFHPVRDYLDGLTWDGKSRLDRWLIDYLGAEDSGLNRAVGAIVLMAAVRRVRQPGCKFDEVMVFESEEGTGKSEAIKILAGQPEWFTDNLSLQDETKVIIENTAGKWLIEYGELEGLQKAETEAVKRMLSRQVDEARLAYGRRKSVRPRQWIAIGTTNNDRYLRSTTGNRRFWPVKVGTINLEALRRDRDLIWAEAAVREAIPDESIRLDPSLYDAAKAAQQRRMVEPPNIDRLIEHLGTVRGGWIAPTDVYRLLGYKDRDPNPGERQGIGQALRDLGFEQWGVRIGGTKRQVWWRGPKPQNKALQIEVTLDNAFRYVVAQPHDAEADRQPPLPSGDVSRALN